MSGLAETRAAYRFFDNDRVGPSKLLQPHRDATLERIRQQPVVLVVQDTPVLHTCAVQVSQRRAASGTKTHKRRQERTGRTA